FICRCSVTAASTAVRLAQSATARMPPRLSLGWPHSAASQVSLKSSQRINVPILKAACTGSSWNCVPGTRAPCGTTVPLDHRAEQLAGSRVFQRFQAAAQRIHQDQASRVVSQRGRHLIVPRIVDDIDDDLVPGGTDIADVCGHETGSIRGWEIGKRPLYNFRIGDGIPPEPPLGDDDAYVGLDGPV